MRVLENLLQLERKGMAKQNFLANGVARFHLETESWKALKCQVVATGRADVFLFITSDPYHYHLNYSCIFINVFLLVFGPTRLISILDVEAWKNKNYLSVSVPKHLAVCFRDFLYSCVFKLEATNAAKSFL